MLMNGGEKRLIELEDGWDILSGGIEKLKSLLDDELDGKFGCDEWMRLYTYDISLVLLFHVFLCISLF